MAGYVERLRAARARSAAAPAPDWSGGLFWAALALLAYIWLAVQVRPDGAPAHFHFVSEDGAITALSAVLLAAGAALACAAGLLARSASHAGAWVWFLFGAALLFFAIDEQMQFHEQLGSMLNTVASRRGATLSWNDILVIGYGAAAVPFLVALLPRLAATPKVPEYLGAAFLMYALHTLVDSVVEPPAAWSVIVEESFKVFAGAGLAAAMLAALVGQVRPGSAPADARPAAKRRKIR
jgi:hypothetical protein